MLRLRSGEEEALRPSLDRDTELAALMSVPSARSQGRAVPAPGAMCPSGALCPHSACHAGEAIPTRTARAHSNTHVSSGIFVWALAQGERQSRQSIIHGTAQGPILQAPAISKGSGRRRAEAPRRSCCPEGAPRRPPPWCRPGSSAGGGPSPGGTAAASAPGAPPRLPGAVGVSGPGHRTVRELRPGALPQVCSGWVPQPGERAHRCGAAPSPLRGAHPRV